VNKKSIYIFIAVLILLIQLQFSFPHNPLNHESKYASSLIEKCTTIIVMPDATADGSIILAKNRDLMEFELQWLYYSPRKLHPPGSKVKLQY